MRYATAYTLGIPVPGFENVGYIAVDTEGSRNYSIGDLNGIPINFVGGVSDYYDDNGYIIISDTTTAGLVGRTTGGYTGTVLEDDGFLPFETVPTFWASKLKTDISFLNLVNNLPQRSGQDAFDNNESGLFNAVNWLSLNGYWTSYVAPILSLDAGNTASYPLENVSASITYNVTTILGFIEDSIAYVTFYDENNSNPYNVNGSGGAFTSFFDLLVDLVANINSYPHSYSATLVDNKITIIAPLSDGSSYNGITTRVAIPSLSLVSGTTYTPFYDNQLPLSGGVSVGTIWRDLVGGKEFNLLGDQGLPTYESGNGGKILFQAADSNYAICNTSLPQMTKFTLSIWHYWNGNNTGLPFIISEIYPGFTGQINYLLGDLGDGLRGGYYDTVNRDVGFQMSPTFSLTPNNWYHIVITCGPIAYLGDGQVIKAYVNNTLVGSTQTPISSPQSSLGGIYLMTGFNSATTDFCDGYLAKVDIYNRALSQRQITSIWNSNRTRFYDYVNIIDSALTQNTINLTVDVFDISTITDTGTVFKTSSPVTITDNPQSAGSVSNGTYQQTRIVAPQTRYYIAAYKTTSAGTVLSSEISKFTLSNPPITQVSELLTNVFSSTTLNLSWSSAVFSTGGELKRYLLLRAADPNIPIFTGVNGNAPTVGANTVIVNSNIMGTEARDFNLTALTTYNYLLIPYTWDGINTETYNYLTASAPTTSGVTSDVVAPTMTESTVSAITNNSAILGATIVTSGGSSIIQRGTIYSTISPVSVSSDTLDEGGTSVGAYSHLRTGLLPESKYYFSGYSVNADGGIALSPEASFYTFANPPSSPVTNLTATASTGTQINLNWTRPNYPSEGATSKNYVIIRSVYPNVPTLVNSNGQAPAGDANTTIVTSTILSSNITYSVTGLQAATRYNFSIIPYTWDGVNDPTRNYYTASVAVVNTTTI